MATPMSYKPGFKQSVQREGRKVDGVILFKECPGCKKTSLMAWKNKFDEVVEECLNGCGPASQ